MPEKPEMFLPLLNFYKKNPVELLLLDISMPGQSGLDLLKSLSPDKIPHTIILTGFATFDYAKDAIKYGVDNLRRKCSAAYRSWKK